MITVTESVYIAQLLIRGSLELVSAGEGKTIGKAKRDAINNLPKQNEDVLESDCVWEIEETSC